MLQKALRYCDMETPGHRQLIYQYRVAKIHYRLASLYHHSLRNVSLSNVQRRKQLVQLCRLHYDRACTLFTTLEECTEILNCKLEKSSVFEYLAQSK